MDGMAAAGSISDNSGIATRLPLLTDSSSCHQQLSTLQQQEQQQQQQQQQLDALELLAAARLKQARDRGASAGSRVSEGVQEYEHKQQQQQQQPQQVTIE